MAVSPTGKKMCENIGSPRAFKLTLNKHWIKLESYKELLPKTHLHSTCGFISPKYLTCVINPLSTHRLFSTTPAVALCPHVFFFFFYHIGLMWQWVQLKMRYVILLLKNPSWLRFQSQFHVSVNHLNSLSVNLFNYQSLGFFLNFSFYFQFTFLNVCLLHSIKVTLLFVSGLLGPPQLPTKPHIEAYS